MKMTKLQNMHLSTDTITSLVGGVAGGTYVQATQPGANPLITQVLIPIIGAIVVPFLKDLSLVAMQMIKERVKARKTKK